MRRLFTACRLLDLTPAHAAIRLWPEYPPVSGLSGLTLPATGPGPKAAGRFQACGGPKILRQVTLVRPFVVDIVTQAVRLCLVPTVLSLLGNRVVIYPNDHRPAHVHVIGGGNEAVFDLRCPSGPPELRENYGFSRRALRQLEAELTDEIALLCGEWSRIHG